MSVTTDLLQELKGRLIISHNGQDSDLEKLLSLSIAYVETKCGKFKIDGEENTDKLAKELVLERTRYAYNDALEYFEKNFSSEIFALGIEMSDADEEV